MCKKTDKIIDDLSGYIKELFSELKTEKTINGFSNSSDDIIYVVDVDKHEIIYVNDEAKRLFGKDIVGKKCYNVFHDLHEECSFCTIGITKKNLGVPYRWVIFNEKLKKLYYIIDVAKEVDGRILRYERAINLNGETKTIVELANKHNLV